MLRSTAWAAVREYRNDKYPIFTAKSTSDLETDLAKPLADWLEKVQTSIIGSGVRRSELEHYVLYACLPTVGILGAVQKDWMMQFLTKFLNDHSKHSCAIIYLPNRAQELDGLKKESDVKKEPTDDEGKLDEEEDDTCDVDEVAQVRDVVNALLKKIGEKSRGLVVQEFAMVFSEGSVFGKRKGFHSGLMILANNPENIFYKSKLYTKGLITDVVMLPRKDARRPRPLTKSEKGEDATDRSLLGVMRQSITPVQVMKQAPMFPQQP